MAANVPIWKGYAGLIELPSSGAFDFDTTIRYTQEFSGTVEDCRLYAQLHARGTFWLITGLIGTFVVASTTVTCARGKVGKATTIFNWLGLNPPDEWSVTPIQNDMAIERHPFFSTTLTQDDLTKARACFCANNAEAQTNIQNAINGSPNADLINKLLKKWKAGEETYYFVGLSYVWTVTLYTLAGVIFRQGGYREVPGGPAVLPPFMTWMRCADQTVWQNGLYRVTRSWTGVTTEALDMLDTDLYGTVPR
jgi:hypothetical protein